MDIPGNKSFLKNLPKVAAGSASLLAALYFAFSPRMSPGLYSKRLFRPEKFPEGGEWDVSEIYGIPVENCYFKTVDGSRLHAWYLHNPDASHVVLVSHGNRGNLAGRRNLITLLIQTGASVFVYDFRGYGRSEGIPSVRGICEDGLKAFDYLIGEKRYKPSQIVVYGESLGTAVTSEIAADRPCAGIILQSGFSSLRRIGVEMVPLTKIYPESLYPKPLLNSALRMAKDKKPLLVIHGQHDQTVPFCHAEEIFNNAIEPKTFLRLANAGHTNILETDSKAFIGGVRKFLDSLPVDVELLG